MFFNKRKQIEIITPRYVSNDSEPKKVESIAARSEKKDNRRKPTGKKSVEPVIAEEIPAIAENNIFETKEEENGTN